MDREWFAAEIDKARRFSICIEYAAFGFSIVVLLSALSIEIEWVRSVAGENAKAAMAVVGFILMVAVLKVGYMIIDKKLRDRRLACPHCEKVIGLRYAKSVVVTGFCPECGKYVFERA